MKDLTHFDEQGRARMVDVGDKPATLRIARASAEIVMDPETLKRIREGDTQKGDVRSVARLAGILAAKRTDDLIPLCHSLPLSAVEVNFDFPSERSLRIEARVRTEAKTGVEMEAMTAASVAALTVYDMCKALDRGMVIMEIKLLEKSGGASGHFERQT